VVNDISKDYYWYKPTRNTISNTASMAGIIASPEITSYVASKTAVTEITRGVPTPNLYNIQ